MNQRQCKNKKCQRPLSDGYKYKYCEYCRITHTEKAKKGLMCAVAFVAASAITIVTKGRTKDD